MALSVTILGCSGSYPGPGAACSGYLVSDGTTRIWLDAGSGSMANLQRHIGLESVDAVVLSHEHPDHWRDVEGFYVALKYRLGREGVPVYAPAGIEKLAYFGEGEMAPHLVWRAVTSGDTVAIGGMQVTFSETGHGPETLAVRVDGGGKSLGYSADAGPEWSLEALGPGLDLALCEATFLQHQEGITTHMSARQAGASGRAAGVGRLVLTHFWHDNDRDDSYREGTEAFGRPVEIALENKTFEL